MSRSKIATDYFGSGYNCAQSVFAAFAADFDMPIDTGLKVSCAFGGGMGRRQKTCGAVTGALMALGMKYGKALNEPEEKKKLTYDKTALFFAEFEKLHGSSNCKFLLNGLDMNAPGDMEKIKSQNLFSTLCPKYVESAVQIAEKLVK
jgi:C_GCAxxG_C_C family probable redox protein